MRKNKLNAKLTDSLYLINITMGWFGLYTIDIDYR